MQRSMKQHQIKEHKHSQGSSSGETEATTGGRQSAPTPQDTPRFQLERGEERSERKTRAPTDGGRDRACRPDPQEIECC